MSLKTIMCNIRTAKKKKIHGNYINIKGTCNLTSIVVYLHNILYNMCSEQKSNKKYIF